MQESSKTDKAISHVQDGLTEIGYEPDEAEDLAEEFVRNMKHEKREEERPDTEVQANSLDPDAGEIIVTIHESSSRTPDDVLDQFLNRYDKNPDNWAVKRKLKNTSDGDSYLAEPIKDTSSSSTSSRSSSQSSGEDLADKADDLSPEEAEKLLEKITNPNG